MFQLYVHAYFSELKTSASEADSGLLQAKQFLRQGPRDDDVSGTNSAASPIQLRCRTSFRSRTPPPQVRETLSGKSAADVRRTNKSACQTAKRNREGE